MKYTHYILKMMVPEWIKLYLNFKLLKTYLSISTSMKKLLVLAKKTKTIREYKEIKSAIMDHNLLMDKMECDNKSFIEAFTEEVEKVETFVVWKYGDLKGKMTRLSSQIRAMRRTKEDLEILYNQWVLYQERKRRKDQVSDDEIQQPLVNYAKIETEYDEFLNNKQELLETFYRFYNETVHFNSYVDVNSEGIRKILKKYKKQMIKGIRKKNNERQQFGAIFKKMNVSNITNRIKGLLFDTEQIMIQNFYPNKPKLCRDSLRKYSSDKKIKLQTLFAFGFFAGFAFIFILIIFFMRYEGDLKPSQDENPFTQVFPCFRRGIALFLLYYWCLALDVWGWNFFRINYKIYLGFNHHFSTLTEILQRVSVLSAVYLLILVIYSLQAKARLDSTNNLTTDVQVKYLFTELKFMDETFLPLIIWVICIGYVLLPTKRILNGEGRQWMNRMIFGSTVGHFIKYESRYTFFTEQFTSLVIPWSDLDYTVCYYYEVFRYGTHPTDQPEQCNKQNQYAAMVVGAIPFLVLCMQGITRARDKGRFWGTLEMWNCIKNFLIMWLCIVSWISTFVEAFKYVWIVLAICCAYITFWWDVRQDWLLLVPNARYKFLRNDLGYNNPALYYILAAVNFVLRCLWTFTISPNILYIFGSNNQMLLFALGCLELMRRLIANFLKIEKEHITNQNLFKTVMDYKFPFESKQTTKQQEDDDDGRNTHWSVSTLHQHSEIEILSKWANEESKSRDLNVSQPRFNRSQAASSTSQFAEEGKQKSHSISQERTPPKLKKAQSGENSIEQIKQSTTQGQFRLTYIVKKEQEKFRVDNSKGHESIDLSSANVNFEILNRAKAQEKLQIQKTLHIQEDNKKYKEIINSFYERFQVTQN